MPVLAVLGSPTYHWKLKKRSFAAFNTRKRYDFGSSVIVGYATPFTIGVSLNCSMPVEMFGVPGISSGSQNGSVWYCQVAGSSRLQGTARSDVQSSTCPVSSGPSGSLP